MASDTAFEKFTDKLERYLERFEKQIPEYVMAKAPQEVTCICDYSVQTGVLFRKINQDGEDKYFII